MKRLAKSGLLILLAAFLLIQFIPIDRANPPVSSDLQAPAPVKAILEESCYDCHSNETAWPWYSYVAPISWLILHDIREARDEYNLSEWGLLDPEEQAEIREEMWEETSEGQMPPRLYRMAHPEARVSEEELAVLRPWLVADLEEGQEEGGRRRRRRRGHND